jgi:hypothetical protein
VTVMGEGARFLLPLPCAGRGRIAKQTTDVQLHIGESRDSGFARAPERRCTK